MSDEVVDFLEEACDGKKHSLTSFCSLETVTDFKMNPQRGVRGQAALISLTGVIAADTDSAEQPVKALLVDDVQLLAPAEAEALKLKLNKMFCFAALAGQVSRKREHEPWSPEENSAKASTCRIFGPQPNRTSASRSSPILSAAMVRRDRIIHGAYPIPSMP